MSYKVIKKLKKLQKLIEEKDGYADCRIILMGLDMDPKNDGPKTRMQMHHNMCCQGHLVLALLEVLKLEAQKMQDDPEFQAAFKEALDETFNAGHTVH